ncbi:unnamed protein product [Brassica rapa subsp. trilocularis]
MVDAYFRTRAYDDEEATAALKYWGPGTLISFQKKISGGAVKKNGGQGDVVVRGGPTQTNSVSHDTP